MKELFYIIIGCIGMMLGITWFVYTLRDIDRNNKAVREQVFVDCVTNTILVSPRANKDQILRDCRILLPKLINEYYRSKK